MTEFERAQRNYEDVKKRTEEKRSRNEEQIRVINSTAERFKVFAWISVFVGFINLVFGLWLTHCDGDAKWREWLSSFGDYAAGTTGVLWALTGLTIVYVAFLGQQMQLLYTEIELGDNQLQMAASTWELEGQKIELKEQNKHLLAQRVENSYFLLYENFLKIREYVKIKRVEGGNKSWQAILESLKKYISGTLIEKTLFKVKTNRFNSDQWLKSYCETFNFIVERLWQNKSVADGLPNHLYGNLSREEIAILFYYNADNEKLKKILVETNFLNYLDEGLLANPEHLNFYKQ